MVMVAALFLVTITVFVFIWQQCCPYLGDTCCLRCSTCVAVWRAVAACFRGGTSRSSFATAVPYCSLVDVALAGKADVGVENHRGMNVLQIAVTNNSTGLVKWLCNNTDLDVNAALGKFSR